MIFSNFLVKIILANKLTIMHWHIWWKLELCHWESGRTLLSISEYFSKRGSQVCCQLANYVSKFGSWAGTSQRSSQVHFKVRTSIVNKCKNFIYKFIKKKAFSSWENTGPIFYCSNMCIGPYTVISTPTMNICLQSKFELWNELANFVASSRRTSELDNVIGKFATNLGTACWKFMN